MPWYFPWSDSLKKRACRYLLQHYLGHFLKEKLTLDQLSVDLYKGTGEIQDLLLDVQSLNEALASYHVPLEIVDGFVGSISVTIPWSALGTENTQVEIRNLEVTLQPRQRDDPAGLGGVMLESMLSSSMTTSMQLAEECMRQDQNAHTDTEQAPFEGLEMFAQTIEAILSRVKVSFVDTIFRIEHLPRDARTGTALEVRISRVQYHDEAGGTTGAEAAAGGAMGPDGAAVYEPPAIAIKNLQLMGLTLYCDEFPAQSRTMSRSPVSGIGEKMEVKESKPIQVAAFSGRQEIKLKLKQAAQLPGPKLDVDCQFGSLNVHLSPRQLHLLLELAQGLASPDLCDNSNMRRRGRGGLGKPMEDADYDKVERDLQRQLHGMRVMDYPLLQPSTLGDDEGEEVYFTLDDPNINAATMSMDSSYSSTTATSHTGSTTSYSTQASRKHSDPKARNKQKDAAMHRLLDVDAAVAAGLGGCGELTRVRARLSFLAVMLLHEDPSHPADVLDTVDEEGGEVGGSWGSERLNDMASKYFGRVQGISVAGQSVKIAAIRDQYSQACQVDHIGMLCKPLTLECSSKSSGGSSVEMTLGQAELVEAVFDRRGGAHKTYQEHVTPEYCQLLTFVTSEDDGGSLFTSTVAHPCLRLKVDSRPQHKGGRRRGQRTLSTPESQTSILLELAGTCLCEIDLTITDRIHVLLNPQPLTPRDQNTYTHLQAGTTLISDAPPEADDVTDSPTDLRITSPAVTLCIRFPIPDLREGVARQPWWRRCLRDESLLIQMCDVEVHTMLQAGEGVAEWDITCRQAHGLFQDNPDAEAFAFLHVASAATDSDDGFDWPRIVIKMTPEMSSMLDEDATEEPPAHDSLNGACDFPAQAASPFSSRKIIYDSEEMVMPAERAEMLNFQEKAAANCRLLIELNLPCVNAELKDKAFLELLYNRLINDLVLWTPESELSKMGSAGVGGLQPPDVSAYLQHFSMCKSAIHQESSSSSEDEDDDPMYSIHGGTGRPRGGKARHRSSQSNMCLLLNITHGQLTAATQLKDENGAILDEPGELLLHVGDAGLAVVSHYDGDPGLSYLSFRSHTASLLNNGLPLLYLSEPGVVTGLQGNVGVGGESHDQMGVALKIRFDPQQNLKEYTVAVGIRGSTLRHRTVHCTWLTQVLELFDLKDYPITGYTLPQILTELHIHIWSCAIDYRPLYLPYRALVTMETFSICSNLLAEADMSLLRFTLDDGALYLSDRVDVRRVDVQKNYVCVLDVGLFELSLRTTNGTDPRYPKLQLKASNNIIHLRTCSDSMHVLATLINYLATDADLQQQEPEPTPSELSSLPSIAPSEDSTPTGEDEVSLTDLMDEAMEESIMPQVGQARATEGGKIYFEKPDTVDGHSDLDDDFSDEDREDLREMDSEEEDMMMRRRQQYEPPMMAQGMHMDEDYLSDENNDEQDDEGDDEFCIIDAPGLGISSRDGEPMVRCINAEPVLIRDNHFSQPLGSTDVLSAPDHYPVPTHRYTVAEVSLVWYMYGGRDFATSKVGRGAFSSPVSVVMGSTGGGKLGWQARGGIHRNVDVLMELQLNKVRLMYDKYPDHTPQAARQVLVIKEVEIRDRLLSSKINKFLYLYTSDRVLRQSHANMLVVKALHVRPAAVAAPPGGAMHVPPSSLPTDTSEECLLRVSLQPLRLNIDQDALFFLKTFFAELSGNEASVEEEGPPPPAPVMQVGAGAKESREPPSLVMFDEMSDDGDEEGSEAGGQQAAAAQPTFFKRFVFSPDVPIRLDYHGKRVSMEHGTLAGLIVGLAHLNCSTLRLKRIHHLRGLLGIDKLLQFALSEWLHDIKTRQLPSILGGVGPIHSLVQLVQGIRDLVWLPIEQYRRDGRIVRGLQRGASSFLTCTAMSALELTNRIVQTVQVVGELSYDLLTPGPSVRKRKREKWRRELNQPADLREGVTNACNIVKEGFKGTAENIVHVAKSEHEQKGMTGAVGGVLRHVPPTIIKPVIIATEATSNILGGMRNQLLPDRKKEEEDKWKPDD